MAIIYYDEAIAKKIQAWIPENSNLRVLHPEETKRLFALMADDSNDKPLKLPFVAISRNNDIKLLRNTKTSLSFDGIRLKQNKNQTLEWNAIPIQLQYQLDIYTKKADEGDEYLRNFLFKLINNPTIYIEIPYNNVNIRHVANIRVLDNIADTSSISERLFSGQFTRWTIQMEIQDAHLFSIPYKNNWKIKEVDLDVAEKITSEGSIETVLLDNDQ